MSNKRPPPILAKKSCVGLIALELAPNYWFKGESDVDEMGDPFSIQTVNNSLCYHASSFCIDFHAQKKKRFLQCTKISFL